MPFNDDMQLFYRPRLTFVTTSNERHCVSGEYREDWKRLLQHFEKLGWLEALRQYTGSPKKIHVVIAMQGTTPIGFAIFKRQSDSQKFHLDSMYVEPTFRFKGIGGRLITNVKLAVRRLGGDELELVDAASYKMPWMTEEKVSLHSYTPKAKASIYDNHGFEETEFGFTKSIRL
jgi:GNAT superfamily N-acetyltransferase